MSSIAYSLPRGSIAYSPTSGIVSRLPIREYEQGGLPPSLPSYQPASQGPSDNTAGISEY